MNLPPCSFTTNNGIIDSVGGVQLTNTLRVDLAGEHPIFIDSSSPTIPLQSDGGTGTCVISSDRPYGSHATIRFSIPTGMGNTMIILVADTCPAFSYRPGTVLVQAANGVSYNFGWGHVCNYSTTYHSSDAINGTAEWITSVNYGGSVSFDIVFASDGSQPEWHPTTGNLLTDIRIGLMCHAHQ